MDVALWDVDGSKSAMLSGGRSFRLRFRPALGVSEPDGTGGGGGGRARPHAHGARRAAPSPSWEVVAAVNNVFGRAELNRHTACCKFLGRTDSLKACTLAAEAVRGATSVTWHRGPSSGAASSGWAGTCFGIVDGTWQPVPVERGQAEADSARRVGLLPLPPAPELSTEWIAED